MKKIIIVLSIISIIACKEQLPAGLNLNNNTATVDTSYIVATLPAPQSKNVLVEESTGVQCANCPAAASGIKALQIANPERVIVAKLHAGTLAVPVKPTDENLANEDSKTIDDDLGGAAEGQPSASIDRIPNTTSGKYAHKYGSGNWPTFINQVLSQPATCNITLSKTISNNNIVLKTETIFLDTTSTPLSIHVYITENKVNVPQDSVYVEGGFPKKVTIADYEHEEVLRKCITPAVVGGALRAGLQEKGRLVQKVFTFAKPNNVNVLANAHAVVFIQNNITKRVLQVKEISLAP